jgi:hypothetical protein
LKGTSSMGVGEKPVAQPDRVNATANHGRASALGNRGQGATGRSFKIRDPSACIVRRGDSNLPRPR